MTQRTTKDKVEVAFNLMEHVFNRYKNVVENESNRHHIGDPNRVEHDFSEKDKAQLDLLRAQLDVAMMEKLNETIVRSTEASDKLGNKLFWLNVFVAALTLAIAAAAVGELFQ